MTCGIVRHPFGLSQRVAGYAQRQYFFFHIQLGCAGFNRQLGLNCSILGQYQGRTARGQHQAENEWRFFHGRTPGFLIGVYEYGENRAL